MAMARRQRAEQAGCGRPHEADRWDAFKVEICDFTQAFSWREAAAKRATMSALRAAAAASREQYTLDPSNTQALQAWQLARLDLQTRHSAIAAEAALRAGTLWEHYGEQSTFYFHHLARQRQAKTSIASLQDPTTGATHTLDTLHGVVATGTLLSNQFSSDSPTGLFRPPPTDPQAQDSLIGALDKFLQSADVQDCEGDADDPMPLKELADTVHDMPRAKSPGADGLS